MPLPMHAMILPYVCNTYLKKFLLVKWQGWIQHDLGGGVLCQLWCRVVSIMCATRLCNCCSRFAYRHVITQITVSHIVSNNFLLYHVK